METNNLTYEQYVEHEVKIRVIQEMSDAHFTRIDETFRKIDQRFDKLESKFENGFIMLVGLIITSIVLPVVLHALKLI